jgi:hypothetical protein
LRARRHPAQTPRELWILLGMAVGILLIASTLVGASILLSRSVGGGGSFFEVWAGARAFLWEHGSPYDAKVAGLAQDLAYGRAAAPGENPYRSSLPFFLLPFFFPFALTESPSVARGVWACLSQAAIVGTVFATLRIIEWKPPRQFLIACSLFAGCSLYAVMALLQGTPVVMLGLICTCVLWAYQTERDEWAGALIVFSLFAWEAGAGFLLLMILRVFHDKRWRVLAGIAMTLIVLGSVSFLIYPDWILPFLTAALATARWPFGVMSSESLTGIFPNQGVLLARGLTILVSGMMVYEWADGRRGDFRQFVWTSCLALAAMPLLGFRTELGNLVVLLPGVGLIGAASIQRGGNGARLAGLVLGIAFAVPWYLFARWVTTGDLRAHDWLLLFYPTLCIVGLYWVRWWFMGGRQPWLDRSQRH